MKKLLFIASIALWLSGCISEIDGRTSYGYYVWKNDSSHKIELSVSGARFNDNNAYDSLDRDGFEVILESGKSYTDLFISSGMGPVIAALGAGSKITVVFDDEYSVEFSLPIPEPGELLTVLPEDYDKDYNLIYPANYVETDVKNPGGCADCAGYRWTYTFTDEDFETAKAYNE